MSENFASKFYKSQTECRELREKLALTEAKLIGLEHVLAPAVDEFEKMQKRYHIETECRSHAEKYAAKMKKQNLKLKRQSQMILEKVHSFNVLDLGDIDAPAMDAVDSSDEGQDVTVLNKKIQTLEDLVQELENKIEKAEVDKLAAYERDSQLNAKIKCLEEQLQESEQQLRDHYESIKSLKRVSSVAWQEFEELKHNYEQEFMLKEEAVKFAHQMMSERDATKRQSAVLLDSATSDERLSSALLTIEDLVVQLKKQEYDHKLQIDKLRKDLESDELVRQIEDMSSKLELAVSENDRLQYNLKELEKWKIKLEKENAVLAGKLDAAEEQLKPLPPPPPPPAPPLPTFFSPLKMLITIRKPKSGESPSQPKPRDAKEQTYEQALKEMMDRIKSGKTLKNAPTPKSSEKSCSAMDNLQQFMSATNRSPTAIDTAMDIETRIKRQKEQAASSGSCTDNELTKTFQRLAASKATRPSN